jgi:Rad3-related DNA helicase
VITKELLNNYITEWSQKTFGATFVYRPGQADTICEILYAWLNDATDAILDAPTGTGKSIIALSVAGILHDYFKKTGYILISDLSLMEQYERDLEKYLPSWGLLKGQQVYTCAQNGLPFASGVCQLNNCKTYYDITTKYECSQSCEYIFARNKAIHAPVTVCTYSLWLLQMNFVRKTSSNPPFDIRDFVICDEAHKLQSIIQSHFSPKFGKEDFTKILAVKNAMDNAKNSTWPEYTELRNKILLENNNDEIYNLMQEYVAMLKPLYDNLDKVKDDTVKLAGDSGKLSKEDLNVIKACNFCDNHFRTFSEYVEIISNIGTYSLVKNDSANDGSIIFNCLDESYLMTKYFHVNCDKKMYMSATIGDPAVFEHDVDIDPAKTFFKKMPSVFDYTNSPIFFVKEFELSYRKKEESLPYIIKMIEKVLQMYDNRRGIIQTGSYAFAKSLKDGLSKDMAKRLILYEDSDTKNDGLELYKCSDNKVLVGPSLIEGLSFDDDLCRFQIIMKVPYPSLADKFVAAKMNYDKQWYSNTTAISILQGVGRGVRNAKDWCVTFILDGCFLRLFHMSYSMFPPEFCSRIQVIDSGILLN